jgi:hypothetical protein
MLVPFLATLVARTAARTVGPPTESTSMLRAFPVRWWWRRQVADRMGVLPRVCSGYG